jgi:hypothetical protein
MFRLYLHYKNEIKMKSKKELKRSEEYSVNKRIDGFWTIKYTNEYDEAGDGINWRPFPNKVRVFNSNKEANDFIDKFATEFPNELKKFKFKEIVTIDIDKLINLYESVNKFEEKHLKVEIGNCTKYYKYSTPEDFNKMMKSIYEENKEYILDRTPTEVNTLIEEIEEMTNNSRLLKKYNYNFDYNLIEKKSQLLDNSKLIDNLIMIYEAIKENNGLTLFNGLLRTKLLNFTVIKFQSYE